MDPRQLGAAAPLGAPDTEIVEALAGIVVAAEEERSRTGRVVAIACPLRVPQGPRAGADSAVFTASESWAWALAAAPRLRPPTAPA